MSDPEALALNQLRHDFEQYCARFVKIKTAGGGASYLIFNRVQRVLWERFILPCLIAGIPIRLWILKARQRGVSTLIIAFILWLTSLNRYKEALIVADDENNAEKLFDKAKFAHKNLPKALKPMVKIDNREELHFANPDSEGEPGLESRITVQTAENSNLGRSRTIQIAHLSEYATWEELGYDLDQRMISLKACVHDLPGTAIFVETTAKGEGRFKEEWEDPDFEVRKVFISWIAGDELRIEGDDYILPIDSDDPLYGNEAEEYEIIKKELILWYPEKNFENDLEALDHEAQCRLRWRRWAIVNKSNKKLALFQQEYPLTPDQAFATTGSGVFDQDNLNLMKKCAAPAKAFAYSNDWEEQLEILGRRHAAEAVLNAFLPKHKGALQVFEPPLPSARYVVGADSGNGIKGGDPSSVCVLRLPDLVQAASYNEIIHPDDFAYVLYALGLLYGKALLGVEINEAGGGAATLNVLQRRLFYPNLYKRQVFESSKHKQSQERFGWRTTPITKPIMRSDLQQLIEDGEIQFHCLETIKQLKQWKIYPDGEEGIKSPGHDDRAVAAMIAVQMAKTAFVKVEREKRKQPPKWSLLWWEAQMQKQGSKSRRKNFGIVLG